MSSAKRGSAIVVVLILILVIIVLVAAGYFFITNKVGSIINQATPEPVTLVTTSAPTPKPTPVPSPTVAPINDASGLNSTASDLDTTDMGQFDADLSQAAADASF